jgi:hypothetical protein
MREHPEALCFVDSVFFGDFVRNPPSQPSQRMTVIGSHKVHKVRKAHKVAGDHTSNVHRKPL